MSEVDTKCGMRSPLPGTYGTGCRSRRSGTTVRDVDGRRLRPGVDRELVHDGSTIDPLVSGWPTGVFPVGAARYRCQPCGTAVQVAVWLLPLLFMAWAVTRLFGLERGHPAVRLTALRRTSRRFPSCPGADSGGAAVGSGRGLGDRGADADNCGDRKGDRGPATVARGPATAGAVLQPAGRRGRRGRRSDSAPGSTCAGRVPPELRCWEL